MLKSYTPYMPSSDKVSLQARIYWRCLSWFKAMKWPSANEADFGDFIVSFDFKKGTAVKRYPDGSEKRLATFQPQKQTRAVSEIAGDIQLGSQTLQLGSPLVGNDGAVKLSIASREHEVSYLEGSMASSILYDDAFKITPIIEGRDVYLAVDCGKPSQGLAVFVASLLVFSRFSAQTESDDLEE